MFNATGVVVLDSFPLRNSDGVVLDSIISSMEEGLLYVLVVRGEGEYEGPFSFSQAEGWISTILNSRKVKIIDFPLVKDTSDRSLWVHTLSKTLENLSELAYREPLGELYCYDSSLPETNPYVSKLKGLFSNVSTVSIEGIETKYSRKELFDLACGVDNLEDYFSLFTPQSYQAMKNYLKGLKGA